MSLPNTAFKGKGGFHCHASIGSKRQATQRQPCVRLIAKLDVRSDSALSIIYALEMLLLQLNVKHRGQEAAQSGQSGLVLVQPVLIIRSDLLTGLME